MYRISKSMADRRERYAGIAAGSFNDSIPGLDSPITVRRGNYVKRHTILDAARKIEVLGFRKDRPAPPFEMKMNSEKRGVSDQVLDISSAGRNGREIFLKIMKFIESH
jgi:hypothetical protein